MLKFLTKKVDNELEKINIKRAKKILEVSESTIRRYIEMTKRGELDFPYEQYVPGGTYHFTKTDLRKWKRKSGKFLT